MLFVALVFALVTLASWVDFHVAIREALYRTSCWTLCRNEHFREAFRRASPWAFWPFQLFVLIYAVAIATVCTIGGAVLLFNVPAKVFSNITIGFVANAMNWAKQAEATIPGIEWSVYTLAVAFTWWFPQLLRKAETKTAGTAELRFVMRLLLSYQLIRRWVFVNLLFFFSCPRGADKDRSEKVPAIQLFASSLLQRYKKVYPNSIFEEEMKKLGSQMEMAPDASPNQLFFEMLKTYGAPFVDTQLEKRSKSRTEVAPIDLTLRDHQLHNVKICNLTITKKIFGGQVESLGFCSNAPALDPDCALQVDKVAESTPGNTVTMQLVASTAPTKHMYLKPARQSDGRALWRLLRPHCPSS